MGRFSRGGELRGGEDGRGVTEGSRVTGLSTTPVKGLALHHPDAILLLRTGAAGDRAFFPIDGGDPLVSLSKKGRLVRFRAAPDTKVGQDTVCSAEGGVWGAPPRRGSSMFSAFY